ncbi:GntR family transcriptional regulator [Chelatococcus asaccharovorans]|uniref:DNA-binding GntR family transcriptional regulator n=1 Tax=Chelatococcus asaccharovorans TaxID=28210 RepID=A0A2V3U013_9HYPH|nr:GntR family transcriptional regulator [Chelatococcus asaccharovorans]MBS7707585.1 GntR family transcriptional regulator [Chelatococcus asaccharovorans]PXW55158.1 DNA-binding GntR family transcriptional regulator [Chelatococcus asaccharovorans]
MTDADDEIEDQPSNAEQNMSAIAFEKIRGMIVAGEIGGGSVVQERRLAAALGLSRTPVREALGRLSGEGYVRREGRVLTVNPILVEDVMEILTVRRAVESEAAEIAAGRFDPVKLCAIRAAVNGMISPAEVTSERHWSVDDLVHLSIAEAAGNRLIVRLVTDLRQRTRMFGLTRIPRRFEPGKLEHLAILDAIEAGDGAAAKAAMRLHIDNARKGILNSLAGEGGRDWHSNG